MPALKCATRPLRPRRIAAIRANTTKGRNPMGDDLTERVEQLETKVRELKKAFEQLESRTTKVLELRKVRDEPEKSKSR
jgi:hypothetical protein